MQVTNNTYTNYYAQTNNTTKAEKTEESSFASMLKDSQKEDVDEQGRFLKYMDKYNAFDSLSQEDRKVFREILKDDKVTMAEIDSLSYNQAEIFLDYTFPPTNLPKEEFNKGPIVNIPNQGVHMLFATRTTNDKTFNEALYRTAREIDDDSYRSKILGQVRMNIAQVHFGYELKASFYAGVETENQWNWDYDNMNINFDDFLTNVISMHENEIENPPNNDPDFIKQHQERLDGYNIILKHYNDIKKESIYV
ncbi:hypothetical protein ACH5BF_06725 [Arcobacter sp. YIC-464]|uniref:hypothetical protein n=1 Tax=Arcobacter sp. YIC-464 TaxID=3376631 RepID=UPI003C2A9E92